MIEPLNPLNLNGIKPNPHHYPIIDKWNWRIYKKHQFEIFEYINGLIEKEVSNISFNNFATINELNV